LICVREPEARSGLLDEWRVLPKSRRAPQFDLGNTLDGNPREKKCDAPAKSYAVDCAADPVRFLPDGFPRGSTGHECETGMGAG
jgi:hypothetical protein